MKKTLLLILYVLALSALAYFVANRMYVLDSKEAIPYVFYYAIFLVFYWFFTVWKVVKTLRSKKSKKLFLYCILLTWIPMIGFPAYSISLSREEGRQRQIAREEREQLEYLNKLNEINQQIAIHLDSAKLYLKRARLYRSNGLYDKAIVEAQKSLALQHSPSGLWELGWNYEISDDLKNAKRIYLIAKKDYPHLDWVDKRLRVVERKLREND